MWTCERCQRNFKSTNQSHTCTTIDIGELFLGKPDDLVLAFDDILMGVANWEPNSIGAARHSIVFTNHKAWLIVKPMKTELDVKFYYDAPIESDRFKRIKDYRNKYAHHIRIKHPNEINEEFFELLKLGYKYALR
ncbi:MAG: DUF5655 domain-containing protein [Saprospiraceae bacterium]